MESTRSLVHVHNSQSPLTIVPLSGSLLSKDVTEEDTFKVPAM